MRKLGGRALLRCSVAHPTGDEFRLTGTVTHHHYFSCVKLIHYDHDGRARFVTFATRDFLPVLSNPIFRDLVTESMVEVCAQFRVTILAYVIMPEHVHLVLVPPVDVRLGNVVGEIKRISAKRIHSALPNNCDLLRRLVAVRDGQCRFALWQKRCYDHNCRTEAEVWQKVEYCHFNPVRRGLVRAPQDWRWSSCTWYATDERVGETRKYKPDK
ncbi:MAG: transposase [Candidatus Zixiibacteriota bacterium]